MRFNHLAVAAIAATCAVVPAAALAQTANPGITYDCDTATDHFSELSLPAGPAPFTVTGKVKMMTSATSKEYLPMARLAISNASADPSGPSDEGWAGFEFIVGPAKTGKAPSIPALDFSTKTKGQTPDQSIIGITSATEVPFSLTYDGAHVTVSVDGHDKQFDFTAAKPVVRITCSTGEFLYTNLVILPRG